MNQIAATAIAHYLGKGLTKDIATGIVAVLMVESGLNPAAENNTGTETPGSINPTGSYGLAQWNGPRQKALMTFASAKNLGYNQINTQLDFVLTECANSYPSVWAAIQTGTLRYSDFIPIFVDSYEDPADKTGEISKAMTYAQEFYAYAVSVPAVAPMPAPAPAPTASTVIPPSTSGATLMDPAVLAILEPLLEALLSAFAKAIVAQGGGTITPASTTATAAPLNLNSLATSVAGIVVPQLATTVQQIVAAELAKVIGAIPGAKTS